MFYREAVRYLGLFTDYEKIGYENRCVFSLDRMRHLAALFNKPQESFSSVHITGTKGKGSVAVFISAVLKEAHLRVGLYTSPHLTTPRERIKINDEMISEDDFAFHTGEIKRKLEEGSLGFSPTYFEVYTLLAFNYFRAQKIDYGIIEVGLGGRLDATNIVKPVVSVITPVSHDHGRILGGSLEAIAKEKSGIIKKGCIVVSAPQDEKVAEIIRKKCLQLGSRLILIGRDIDFSEVSHSAENEIFDVAGQKRNYGRCVIKLLGRHQIENAACAIGAIEGLDRKIAPEAVRSGLKKGANPARCEIISKDPRIVLDGAQNRASAEALKKTIKRNFDYKRLILVLGISKGKDIRGVCGELLPRADHVILTKAVTERAEDPRSIARFARGKNVILTNSVSDAVEKARSLARADDVILVTGSLYVAGEAREMLLGEDSRESDADTGQIEYPRKSVVDSRKSVLNKKR